MRRGVLESGLPVERAVAAATLNPARLLGIDTIAGSIAFGKRADLLYLDDDLRSVRRRHDGRWLALSR